jgi:hypothetical protein
MHITHITAGTQIIIKAPGAFPSHPADIVPLASIACDIGMFDGYIMKGLGCTMEPHLTINPEQQPPLM